MSQLPLGLKQKELGLSIVEENNSKFVETGRGIARMLIQKYGKTSMDEVRDKLEEMGLQPKNRNAFGAIFRGNEFEAIGFTASRHESRHGAWIRVWRLRSEAI